MGHVGYARNYEMDSGMTTRQLRIRDGLDLDIPGIPLLENEVCGINLQCEVGCGDKPLRYFTNSLCKLRLCGETDKCWYKIRNKLLQSIREYIDWDENDDDCIISGDQIYVDGAPSNAQKNPSQGVQAVGESVNPLTNIPLGANAQLFYGCECMVPSRLEEMITQVNNDGDCLVNESNCDPLVLAQ